MPTRQNMVHYTKRHRDVFQHYEVLRYLDEGSMGNVQEVRKKVNAIGGSAYTMTTTNAGQDQGNVVPESVIRQSQRKTYALKSIILSRVSVGFIEELRNEVKTLQGLDHPNIVKLYEVYETPYNMYLILENCSGGNLRARGPYKECSALHIISQVLSAVLHMHNHNVTHCDLKYENIMFESNRDDAQIKLIDFGLAKKTNHNNKCLSSSCCGTRFTMAPEIWVIEEEKSANRQKSSQKFYTSQVDMWSLGVVSFMLLASYRPFFGKNMKENICNGLYEFRPYETWNDDLSKEAKDFVQSLIVVKPEDRLTAEEAMGHPWLNEEEEEDDCNLFHSSSFSSSLSSSSSFSSSASHPTRRRRKSRCKPQTSSTLMQRVKKSIIAYNNVPKFKKLALMVIAHKHHTNATDDNDEIAIELRKAFQAFDQANDGVIHYNEFKTALMEEEKNNNETLTDHEISQLFTSLDTGNDGRIYYTEFLAAMLAMFELTQEAVANAFDRMDCDDTGYITRENLSEFLGKDFTDERVNELLKEGDITGDGRISFQEFLQVFKSSNRVGSGSGNKEDEDDEDGCKRALMKNKTSSTINTTMIQT